MNITNYFSTKLIFLSKNVDNDKFFKLRKEKMNISSSKKPLILKKEYIISEDKNKSKDRD